MRQRVHRREKAYLVLIPLVFILGLIGINSAWPAGFGMFIAIGGTAGALMVLYEVRLTKRIAQAEFIRDLQNSFSSDANIGSLWSKLLLDKPITEEDRPLVSSYLTFFETMHLLHAKGTIDLELIDELFRNRFFKAIGNPDILRTTLVKDAGSFTNIHELVADWHDYLVKQRKPIHLGYYTYVTMLMEAKGFEIERLGVDDLGDLLQLQDKTIREMSARAWLRHNDEAMLLTCLTASDVHRYGLVTGSETPHHLVVGARKAGKLVAAAILFDGGSGNESIKSYLTEDIEAQRSSINLKLVLSDPDHRRSGLGRSLVELLELEARAMGKTEILCTIHAKNTPSQNLFKLLGYEKSIKVRTSYGERHVFLRPIRTVDATWFR